MYTDRVLYYYTGGTTSTGAVHVISAMHHQYVVWTKCMMITTCLLCKFTVHNRQNQVMDVTTIKMNEVDKHGTSGKEWHNRSRS